MLRLLVEGRSTSEFATRLCISPRTAGAHISNFLGKFEVNTLSAAVAYALKTGIV